MEGWKLYIKSLAPTRSLENSSHGIRPIVFLESLKSLAFAAECRERMSGVVVGGGGPFTFYCGRNNARAGVQRKAQRNYNHAQQQQPGKERNASSAPPIKILPAQVSAAVHLFLSRASEREKRGWNLPSMLCSPPPLTIEANPFGCETKGRD
jgi:hypothetical protein